LGPNGLFCADMPLRNYSLTQSQYLYEARRTRHLLYRVGRVRR